MKKQSQIKDSENDIVTFRRIRKAIGWLGIGLPIVLVMLSLLPFFKTAVQASISYYYYTNFREVFTGILCAVGLFLIRYKGQYTPEKWENYGFLKKLSKNDGLLTNIAGCMALGIALFPTNPDFCAEKIYSFVPLCVNFLGWLHYGFAAIFFIILSILSISVFTIRQQENKGIQISIVNENHIYILCGYLILASILMVPVFAVLKVFNYSTILFEATALFAFGISWLIKGRALGDKGKIGEKLYREHHKA